jgi:hypothetical protein
MNFLVILCAKSGAWTKHINSQKPIKILPMSADILIDYIAGGGVSFCALAVLVRGEKDVKQKR